MTKEEMFKMMNENPVMHLATVDENGFPHVRGILMFKAGQDGIIFHTGDFKNLYSQLMKNPNVELCFQCNGIQIRVEGKVELDESDELFEEVYNHPSRAFLKQWGQTVEELRKLIKIYRLKNGKAHTWTMADNFKPKEYIDL
ncbi:MAG: pyridoxamine 5'-phosphate oxidase family protein [Treponema sp.]|nr:pyridoxamine 5'-phosphate oxidase family protein [Candidatus Treponema equifaecale]